MGQLDWAGNTQDAIRAIVVTAAGSLDGLAALPGPVKQKQPGSGLGPCVASLWLGGLV